MNEKVDEFWKMAGEIRKINLDLFNDFGGRLTPEEVLRETVNAVLDATLVAYPKARLDFEFEDFLHDVRSECFDSIYLRCGGTERNG